MSEARQERVLDELGLLPLWVRRELVVAERPRVAASNDTAASNDAVPPARAEAAAAPAEAIAVPTSAEPPPRPMRQTVIPASAPAPAPTAPADNGSGSVERDQRAAAIAAMDWEQLQAAVASCTACGLCKSRNRTVFGVGNPEADWLIVGEAPGAEEDRLGEPFVGQAGKLLDSMLASVELNRRDGAFILNTLKCRPPQNRNPNPDELALCAPFLHRQVELIRPKVIFAVGRFAVQTLLGREASIASLRGKRHDYRGVPVVVSYHPAYLLRNMPDKIKAWQDLLLARRMLAASAKSHNESAE